MCLLTSYLIQNNWFLWCFCTRYYQFFSTSVYWLHPFKIYYNTSRTSCATIHCSLYTVNMHTVIKEQQHFDTRVSLIASRHSQIGTSKLPVLLKVNRGREILVSLSVCSIIIGIHILVLFPDVWWLIFHSFQLNWTGVTVECGYPYVHFTSHQHKFAPVPIGGHAYPRQVLCMFHVPYSQGLGKKWIWPMKF